MRTKTLRLGPKLGVILIVGLLRSLGLAQGQGSALNPTSSNLGGGASASALDPKVLASGTELYLKLKTEYPDAPDTGQWSIPPHAIGIVLNGGMGSKASLELDLPAEAWAALSAKDRIALVAYLRAQVRKAQENSDPFTKTPKDAPAYLAEKQTVQGMKNEAWLIRVGHMDKDHYLVPDKTVVSGADYSSELVDATAYIYADPRVDAVFGSPFDGSVSQIKDYLYTNLNDADSVRYVSWTKVVKTGDGYQASVTYRAKNAYGAYVLVDQKFSLDKSGQVIKVTPNHPGL